MKSLYFRILNFDFSIKSAYDFTDLLVPVLKNAARRQACLLKMVAEPILHSELKLFGLNSISLYNLLELAFRKVSIVSLYSSPILLYIIYIL